MDTSRVIGMIVAGLVQACITFVIVLFMIKWLWPQAVGELFPGALEWEFFARDVSWPMAAKLAAFVGVLSALFGGHYQPGSKGEE